MEEREEKKRYRLFSTRLGQRGISNKRILTNELSLFAYSTDASFYRLVPKVVVLVQSEVEVQSIIALALEMKLPLTFRAAGTSLSGQASCNSILVVLFGSFRKFKVLKNGELVNLEPGVLGGQLNRILKLYRKKIGPDPASIDSAMIGGIVANNASGMCCGTEQNSYKTVEDIRVVLANGEVVDTRKKNNSPYVKILLQKLSALNKEVQKDTALTHLIKKKYSIKNTTGYSLNALVDYQKGMEIFKHLMIGSEGTLGFISQVTLKTVDLPFKKAVALYVFKDIFQATIAVTKLAKNKKVSAIELMDSVSLSVAKKKKETSSLLPKIDKKCCGLLIEIAGNKELEIKVAVKKAQATLREQNILHSINFSSDEKLMAILWSMRKGLFPTVGTLRKTGTAVVIEDVAFPMSTLAKATKSLRALLDGYGYKDAVIFGHALAGNLHFVFSQSFEKEREKKRYKNFIADLVKMVLAHEGSLKAEHGTGRNMAPFVELQWGEKAYGLMKRIKEIFDPHNLLNPDVVISSDPKIHLKNFKVMSGVSPIVDKCTDCGFCESHCPSRNYTITPRQRIAIMREIARLQALPFCDHQEKNKLKELKKRFEFAGDQTCAVDGVCSLACPVDINTGSMIKEIRKNKKTVFRFFVLPLVFRHYNLFLKFAKWQLRWMEFVKKIVFFSKKSFWNFIPNAAKAVLKNRYFYHFKDRKTSQNFWKAKLSKEEQPVIVYMPSCLSHLMQPVSFSEINFNPKSLSDCFSSLLLKSGLEQRTVVLPPSACCGLTFSTKGRSDLAEMKKREVLDFVKQGKRKEMVLVGDLSSCSVEWKKFFAEHKYSFCDMPEFLLKTIVEKIEIKKLNFRAALFHTCATSHMKGQQDLEDLARLCVEDVEVVDGIACCGFAGDKGFLYPQLNASALQELPEKVRDCRFGIANNLTCEIGLTKHSGIPFLSILALLDYCSGSSELGQGFSLKTNVLTRKKTKQH